MVRNRATTAAFQKLGQKFLNFLRQKINGDAGSMHQKVMQAVVALRLCSSERITRRLNAQSLPCVSSLPY